MLNFLINISYVIDYEYFPKVQQKLAEKQVLELFINDSDSLQSIRNTFVGLYSLDNVSYT